MARISRRELIMLMLIAGLVTGWGWDHVRTVALLRRETESERYFRQRLFESLEEKVDLKARSVATEGEEQPSQSEPRG